MFRSPATHCGRAHVASLVISAGLLLPLAVAQPANDTCATATNIATLPYSDTPNAALANSGPPSPTCDNQADPNGRYDVWYRYFTGANVLFSMNETSPNDTFHAIYTGTCAGLTQVFCTDSENASFSMTAGTIYYIRVGFSPTGGPIGSYSVHFDVTAPPTNDDCATARFISPAALPFSDTVDAAAANDDTPDVPCNSGSSQRAAVWYRFTPSVTGSYTIAETSANDTFRAVWSGSCGSLVLVNCTSAETADVSLTAGTQYYISCGMQSSAASPSEPYTLTVALAAAAPANDTCATAKVIAAVPYSDTVDAVVASDDLPDVSCNSGTTQRRAVWYVFTPTVTGDYTLAETSASDTFRAVWTGSCGALTESACSNPESQVVSLTAGTQYYISCGMWSAGANPSSPYTLTLELLPPSNDTCATATLINSLPYSDTPNAWLADSGLPSPTCDSQTDPNGRFDIWYQFTPSVDTGLLYDLPSGSGTFTAVYTGSCAGLTEVACSPFTIGSFFLSGGTTYWIRIGYRFSSGAPSGCYDIHFDVAAPPSNDDCATATVINPAALPYSDTVEGILASDDLPDASCNTGTSQRRAVWYAFTPNLTGAYLIQEYTGNDDFVAAWTGSCGALTEVACGHGGNRVPLTAGTQYWISIGMRNNSANPVRSYILTLELPAPTNDTCDTATTFYSLPYFSLQNAFLANSGAPQPFCNGGNDPNGRFDVWYKYTPAASHTLVLDETSAIDTFMALYTGTCSGLSEVACTHGAHAAWPLDGGTTYYLRVGFYSSVGTPVGNYAITFDEVPPPANDECSGPTEIACDGSATVDNTGATVNPADPSFACRIGGAGQGVYTTWFKFQAATSTAVVDTEGSAVSDTLLQVFGGACGSLTVIGCDDDSGTGYLSSISLSGLVLGSTYYVEVANWSIGNAPGNVTVNLRCPPPPANDECVNAIAIPCGGSATVDNTDARTAPSDPNFTCSPGQHVRSVWFTFAALGTTATVDTAGSTAGDPIIQVYSGTCGSLTPIGCDDDSGLGLNSYLSLTGLTAGATYYIEACNFTPMTPPGNMTVNVACGGVPCAGDADGDGDVDQDDLDLVLFYFGTSEPPGTSGDVDGDGDVDQDDLDLVLFYFGVACP